MQLARDVGAASVCFVSASPAIIYPNVYGIDMPVCRGTYARVTVEQFQYLLTRLVDFSYNLQQPLAVSVQFPSTTLGHWRQVVSELIAHGRDEKGVAEAIGVLWGVWRGHAPLLIMFSILYHVWWISDPIDNNLQAPTASSTTTWRTVRPARGRLGARSVFRIKSALYGGFLCPRGALNDPF